MNLGMNLRIEWEYEYKVGNEIAQTMADNQNMK
jgi:hypothetical protein